MTTTREPHTVAAAMARGELDEEEAYFVLRFAGHYGYSESIRRLGGLWKRLRHKVIWIGGWERPELLQWDEGLPAFEPRRRGRWADPTPMTLFGRITYYGWGIQVELKSTYLVVVFARRNDPGRAYLSTDGTPGRASRFFWGGPT